MDAVLIGLAAVLLLTIVGECLSDAGRVAERKSRNGHNAHDSECEFWVGDFAGVDLRARCKACNPEYFLLRRTNDLPSEGNNYS